MIFLTDRRDPGTVLDWLATEYGQGMAATTRVITYQRLAQRPALPPETCVFADLERLSPAMMALAVAVHERLRAAGVPTLNDPARVLTRGPLLARLAELGRNDFRARHLDDLPDDLRFPVFVRRESEHDGPLTPLLHDPDELRRALRRLLWPYGPCRRADLLVVEYLDAAAPDGRFGRYSAFRVGDHLIPRYWFLAHGWVVKSLGRVVDRADADAEWRYFETFPHEDWLRETFDIAAIDYGRIDYSEVGGRLQTWEINTNPSIGRRLRPESHHLTDDQRRLTSRARETFHSRFAAALAELDAGTGSAPFDLGIARGIIAGVRREQRRFLAGAVWRVGTARTLGAVLRRLERTPRIRSAGARRGAVSVVSP